MLLTPINLLVADSWPCVDRTFKNGNVCKTVTLELFVTCDQVGLSYVADYLIIDGSLIIAILFSKNRQNSEMLNEWLFFIQFWHI